MQNLKKQKGYTMGIDIGTSSVGCAVIDRGTFKVMRKGKHKLWSVRLFDEADSAEETRHYRSVRRGYDRRRKRIMLLRELLEKEICQVDPQFYQKLDESFYHEDDKNNRTVFLSSEEKTAIIEYNQKFPTIYHLRQHLLNTKEKVDIRLVYLAIHHMIKYRGNFLIEKQNFQVRDLDIVKKTHSLLETIEEVGVTIAYDHLETFPYDSFEDVFFLNSKTDQRLKIEQLLQPYFAKEFIDQFKKAILGDKFSISKMFNMTLEKDIKIDFKADEYEEAYEELSESLNEQISILEEIKELYDMIFLKQLFHGSDVKSLSDLMVNRYAQQKKDLAFLKSLFRYDYERYKLVFKSQGIDKECLYEQYISNHITYEDFEKTVMKYLEEVLPKVTDQKLLNKYTSTEQERILNAQFLPRITSKENGKYPYQLNKEELIQIIENQKTYYPCLGEKLKDGTYKLVRLLEFRIPYYVGPLNDTTKDKGVKNPNAWMVRKVKHVPITPYNFYDIVDLEASAEAFIQHMLGHCTYLLNEYVMPKHSIFYSEFKVRNELKQIKVNGKRLSLDLQQDIFDHLIKITPSFVTDRQLQSYLRGKTEFSMYDTFDITGYSAEKKFSCNMKSYVDFFGENGIFQGTNYNEEDAEQIIEWITIFEDKDILEKKVRQNYQLNDHAMQLLLSKRYREWSSLSKALLNTPYYPDPATGNKKSIMDLMKETPLNFMQILYDEKFHFQDMISEFNGIDKKEKINYRLVKDLVTSPSVKRGIYQSLKMIESYIDFIGYEPDHIVIEMARGDEKKGRIDDRKKRLEKLYQQAKQQIQDYKKLSNELKNQDKIDSDKLLLYFLQEGKSLYSDTPLDITKLSSYEIDHIIPRSLIKDDSIDNKALVLREENQAKAANYVLPLPYRSNEQKRRWERMRKLGLMSAKKYNNLCRDKYSNSDIEGFINRQLVEARQIIKHVADIVRTYYPTTQVICLPAKLSHLYREKFELYKFRDINDYHHAHDAYLAAVLGEYRATYFKSSVDFDQLKELQRTLLEQKRYRELNAGYFINSMDNTVAACTSDGEIILDFDQLHKTIKDTMYQQDIVISKKTEIQSGKFYKETLHKKDVQPNGVRLKQNLPMNLYGYYTGIEIACGVLVEYGDEVQHRIVGVPMLVYENSKKDPNCLINFVKEHLNLQSETLKICRFIPINALLNYKGQFVYFRGYSTAHKNCEVINATELRIPRVKLEKWKYVLNLVLNNKKIPVNQQHQPILSDQEVELQIDEIVKWLLNKKSAYPLYEDIFGKLERLYQTVSFKKEEKFKILQEIFKLFNTKAQNADLSFIEEGKFSTQTGRLSSRNITVANIIDCSITGMRQYSHEFSNGCRY